MLMLAGREADIVGINPNLRAGEMSDEFVTDTLADQTRSAAGAAVADGGVATGPASATPAPTGRVLFFLIKLLTVSDGRAPRAIQYSARSNFKVLLSPGFFGS